MTQGANVFNVDCAVSTLVTCLSNLGKLVAASPAGVTPAYSAALGSVTSKRNIDQNDLYEAFRGNFGHDGSDARAVNAVAGTHAHEWNPVASFCSFSVDDSFEYLLPPMDYTTE